MLRRSKSTGSASELDALKFERDPVWFWIGPARIQQVQTQRRPKRHTFSFNHLITSCIVRAEHSSCGTTWPPSNWGIQMWALQKSHKAARQCYWFPHQMAFFTNVALYRHAPCVALWIPQPSRCHIILNTLIVLMWGCSSLWDRSSFSLFHALYLPSLFLPPSDIRVICSCLSPLSAW